MAKLLPVLTFTVPSSLPCVNGTIGMEQNSGDQGGMKCQIRRLLNEVGLWVLDRAMRLEAVKRGCLPNG